MVVTSEAVSLQVASRLCQSPEGSAMEGDGYGDRILRLRCFALGLVDIASMLAVSISNLPKGTEHFGWLKCWVRSQKSCSSLEGLQYMQWHLGNTKSLANLNSNFWKQSLHWGLCHYSSCVSRGWDGFDRLRRQWSFCSHLTHICQAGSLTITKYLGETNISSANLLCSHHSVRLLILRSGQGSWGTQKRKI